MDESKYLILVWDKSQSRYQDCTAKVETIEPHEEGFDVTYRNHSRVYRFGAGRLKFFQEPKSRCVGDDLVFVDGHLVPGVQCILKFGEFTKLRFNQASCVVETGQVKVDRNRVHEPEIRRILAYFSEVAAILGRQQNGSSFLEDTLQSIQHLSDDSVLATYLRGGSLQTGDPHSLYLFPFGVNQSQKLAVERAFQHRISIIQGPPGTGKTQTILNIIATALYQNQTVAVVSSNNSATQNVFEKLEKLGYGFLAAPLGNSQNQKDFFSSPLPGLQELAPWIAQGSSDSRGERESQSALDELNQLLGLQNEAARLREKKSRLLTEQGHFLDRFPRKAFRFGWWSLRKHWSSRELLSLLSSLEENELDVRAMGIVGRLRLFFRLGVFRIPDTGDGLQGFVRFLHQTFYETSLTECTERILEIESRLQIEEFDALMKTCQEVSQQVLRNAISSRFQDFENRDYSEADVRSNHKAFSRRFPIVLSTTHSIRRCIQKGFSFDYVVIDEASQVDLVTAAIAMSCSRSLVIVGDPMQLPHIVDRSVRRENLRLMTDLKIPDAYDYTKHHVIGSLEALYGDEVPITLLKEHYRCHPQIIRFCNQKYYNDELVILTQEKVGDCALQLIRTTPGNHERRAGGKSWINRRQIEVIRDEVIPKLEIPAEQIGIVTPYREQANLARDLVGRPEILCETVHKFQGREKEAIVISPVQRKPCGFVDDKQMLNVAVSRARSRLILVAASNFETPHGSNFGDLVRYISYVGGPESVVESRKVSIFDCLYSEYAAVLKPLLERVCKVSPYRSENLMHALIRKVLRNESFESLKVLLHFPLRYLVPDLSSFSIRERTFIEHPFTHVDFVIFNKLGKDPVLVIEVDGYRFHQLNPKQRERDAIKDRVLTQIGLPFIRFSTDASNEESLLENALTQALRLQKSRRERGEADENRSDP